MAQVPAQFSRLAFLAAILIHAVTAWYSTGYHASDEHHQIIAFAQHRLGELPEGHLAWEHEHAMRSSVQPWIALIIIQGARGLGLQDPMSQELLLRLLTAALALFALWRLLRAVIPEMPVELVRPLIMATWSLWFLPYLLVRFSSETWSGLFFLLGLASVLGPERGRHWSYAAGAFLAAAVLVRPPMAVAVLGLLAWMRIVRGHPWYHFRDMLLGALLVSLAGLLLDSLFYQRFAFSPWNYSIIGITGPPEHMRFDPVPWWYYPPWIVKYAIPPIGLALLFAFAMLLWRDRRHVLLWCLLPFLVAHTLLPYKEPRFLYPMAALMPWLLVKGWALARDAGLRPGRWPKVAVLGLLLAANTLGLAVVMTQPAGTGRTAFLPALRAEDPVPITHVIEPELAWRIALPHFHRAAVPGDTAIALADVQGPLVTPLAIARAAERQALGSRTGQHPRPIAAAHAPWAEWLLRLYHWNDRPVDWTLFRMEDNADR